MSTKSKLIVLFPLYNGEKTILQSLECIANQTFHDFRAIVVENHSTDRSKKIAEEFAKKDTRFEVVQNPEHVGPVENFVNALSRFHTQADYICLRAHDDFSSSNYLEKLVKALDENSQAEMAVCDCVHTKNGEVVKHKTHHPRVMNFQEHMKNNQAPRRLSFPAEWFYGLYRCGLGSEILIRRLPELGTPWCAASYVLAEFVVRDLLVHVPDTKFEWQVSSDSRSLYGTLPVGERFKARWEYGQGIWELRKHLGRLSPRQELRMLEIAWRDAKKKTGYYILGI